jgi:uncharacterized protein
MRAQALAQTPSQAFVHESDRDLETLDRFLKSDRSPPNSMMLSELDGFLTGICIGPELVRPDEWLSLVWGGQAPAFASADEATTIVGALMFRRDEILREIADGAFAPVFWKDRGGKIIAADWAEGHGSRCSPRAAAPSFWFPSSGTAAIRRAGRCSDSGPRRTMDWSRPRPS